MSTLTESTGDGLSDGGLGRLIGGVGIPVGLLLLLQGSQLSVVTVKWRGGRGKTDLVGHGNGLEVDVLTDDGGLSVEASRLSLVLAESARQQWGSNGDGMVTHLDQCFLSATAWVTSEVCIFLLTRRVV